MKKKYGKMSGVSLSLIQWVGIILSTIFSIFLLVTIYLLAYSYNDVNDSILEYTEWEKKVWELEKASDYLTENVRCFVINEDKEYLDNYFNEINVNKRRDNVIENLEIKLKDTDAFNVLVSALDKSNELMLDEIHAMKLIVLVKQYDINSLPTEIINYVIPEEEIALSNEEKVLLAQNLVFGEEYKNIKDYISNKVDACLNEIDRMMIDKINQSSTSLRRFMVLQQAIIFLMIVFLFTYFIINYFKIVIPLKNGFNSLLNDELLRVKGIKEYKYFAEKYNSIRMKENDHNIKLEYQAEHDNLTGLYNRTGYDKFCKNLSIENTVYILLDIDNFKLINDKYGHQIGDLVIKRTTDMLTEYFGVYDMVARIGGDEFAIIICNNENAYEEIKIKVEAINSKLISNVNNIPGVTLSFGVAKGNSNDNISSLSVKADKALYETKRNGRANVTFYKD